MMELGLLLVEPKIYLVYFHPGHYLALWAVRGLATSVVIDVRKANVDFASTLITLNLFVLTALGNVSQ